MSGRPLCAAVATLLLVPVLAAAQTGGGVSVGAVRLANGATQRDLNGTIGVQPRSWLTVTATVSEVHVATGTTGGQLTSNGLGDLPVSVGAAHTFADRHSTELGATLDLSLPTGDAAVGLGTGSFGMSGGIGAGIGVGERLRLAIAASRELTGSAGTSALSPARATALAAEGDLTLDPRWTAALSLAADVGPHDSTQALDRSVGIGGRYAVHGPLGVTLDLARGLTGGAPTWAVVLGFGTTIGGNNPAGGALSSRRIAHGVSAAVGRGQGAGHVGHGHP